MSFVFDNDEEVTVDSHGTHDFVYADGVPVRDNGDSTTTYEDGTGIGLGPRKAAFPDRYQTAPLTGFNALLLQEVGGPDPPNEIVNNFAETSFTDWELDKWYKIELNIPDPVTGTHSVTWYDTDGTTPLVTASGSPTEFIYEQDLLGFQATDTNSPGGVYYSDVRINGNLVEDFDRPNPLDIYRGDLDQFSVVTAPSGRSGKALYGTTVEEQAYGISTTSGLSAFPRPGDTVTYWVNFEVEGLLGRLYYLGA